MGPCGGRTRGDPHREYQKMANAPEAYFRASDALFELASVRTWPQRVAFLLDFAQVLNCLLDGPLNDTRRKKRGSPFFVGYR